MPPDHVNKTNVIKKTNNAIKKGLTSARLSTLDYFRPKGYPQKETKNKNLENKSRTRILNDKSNSLITPKFANKKDSDKLPTSLTRKTSNTMNRSKRDYLVNPKLRPYTETEKASHSLRTEFKNFKRNIKSSKPVKQINVNLESLQNTQTCEESMDGFRTKSPFLEDSDSSTTEFDVFGSLMSNGLVLHITDKPAVEPIYHEVKTQRFINRKNLRDFYTMN